MKRVGTKEEHIDSAEDTCVEDDDQRLFWNSYSRPIR
jgi:hypothetical protein